MQKQRWVLVAAALASFLGLVAMTDRSGIRQKLVAK